MNKATVSKNQSKIRVEKTPMRIHQMYPNKNIWKKVLYNSKYFHPDFIEKGTQPKYLGIDIAYVSEQQVLDDLYLLGKTTSAFYTCQSTGATF